MQVGTISANGDETIGKMIAEAMQKVGNEGVITVEEAKSLDSALPMSPGGGMGYMNCQSIWS